MTALRSLCLIVLRDSSRPPRRLPPLTRPWKPPKKLGVTFPLEDLLLSRPFGDGASKAISGSYYGLEPILGAMCHHVGFRSEAVDWQAWIEDGAVPLVRKALIDFKTEPGSPRWMVHLNKLDLETLLPDFVFQFEPPPGAVEIEFVKTEDRELRSQRR